MDRLVSTQRRRAVRRTLLCSAVLAGVLALVLVPAAGARRAAAAAPAVAYVKGQHIWTVAPDGTGARQLTKGTSEDGFPAWSPDHSTIAFVRGGQSGKAPGIYTVPAGGGTPALLYRDSIPKVSYIQVTGLSYSPDGSRLAFADVYSATGALPIVTRLVVIDVAGGRASLMLKKNGGFGNIIVAGWRVAWSPDGARILISQQGQDDEGNGTWVYTVVSGATKKVLANASAADWGVDGATALPSLSTQSRTSIRRTTLGGKVLRTLASGGGWQGAPSVGIGQYSPDWSRVVYVKDWRTLWVMGADGSGRHKLTAGSQPAW